MLNDAVVAATFGLVNVTVPGPLTLLQVVVNALTASSATLPLTEARFGRVPAQCRTRD